jgi:hypothetical protein
LPHLVVNPRINIPVPQSLREFAADIEREDFSRRLAVDLNTVLPPYLTKCSSQGSMPDGWGAVCANGGRGVITLVVKGQRPQIWFAPSQSSIKAVVELFRGVLGI